MELIEKEIKKAIDGDETAFALLFLSIQNKLYRIAFSRLKSEADSLDAIQNTILIVYNNLHKLKDFSAFDSWIIKILINECNKIYSKNKKVQSDSDSVLEFISYEDTHEDLLFYELLKTLSTKEKLVTILYYKNNYTIELISNKTNLNKNTIKSLLHRSRKKLKKILKEDNFYDK